MNYRSSLPVFWALYCSATAQAAQPERSLESLQAQSLLPLEARSTTFAVTDGGAERRLPLVLRPAEEGPGWELELHDMNTLHLLQRDDGSIVIERLDVQSERETVFYEPPVMLLPADIAPKRRWTGQGRARIYDWDMDAVEHRGTYQHEVKPVSSLVVEAPAGRFETYLVEIDQSVLLEGPGEVRVGLDTAYAPGIGIVQRSMAITIDKPLWFGETRRRTIALAESQFREVSPPASRPDADRPGD